jgi:hypothetical protein
VDPAQRLYVSPVRLPSRRGGGFAVTEGDDPVTAARDIAKFAPFLEYTVYPVVDVAEGAAAGAEAVEWRKSIT